MPRPYLLVITVFVFIFLESVRFRFEAGYVGVALDKSLHPNDRVFDFTTAPGFLSAAQYAVLIFFLPVEPSQALSSGIAPLQSWSTHSVGPLLQQFLYAETGLQPSYV